MKTFLARRLGVCGLILVLLVICTPTFGAAETKLWVGASGNWEDSDNWSPWGIPQDGDNAFLLQTDSLHREITYMDQNPYCSQSPTFGTLWLNALGQGTITLNHRDFPLLVNDTIISNGRIAQSGGTFWSNDLSVGFGLGSSGRYELTGGSMGSFRQHLGAMGSGILSHQGGSNSVWELRLGSSSTGSGIYDLQAGELYSDKVYAGDQNTGTFTHSGGSHLANDIYIGYQDGGYGVYTLSGTGSLEVRGKLEIGTDYGGEGTLNQNGGSLATQDLTVGYKGLGSVKQTAGTSTISRALIIGSESSGSGRYELSGTGSISGPDYTAVGMDGEGSFTQRGGSLSTYRLSLVWHGTGKGSYAMEDGSLRCSLFYVGDEGQGSVSHSGGEVSVTIDTPLGTAFILGYNRGVTTGTGTYELKGTGRLIVRDGYTIIGRLGEGTFIQRGGSAEFMITYLGHQYRSWGSYELSGGTLESGLISVGHGGSGRFIQTGGTHTSDALLLGYWARGQGTYALRDTGVLSIRGDTSVGNLGRGEFELWGVSFEMPPKVRHFL